MSSILSISDLAKDHWQRCADEARRLYKHAVRPIFRRLPDGRPQPIGSSVLVEIDGIRCLATAAHVLGWRDESSLHLGTRSEIIPMNVTFEATPKSGGRDDVDLAVAPLSAEQVKLLDGAPFIGIADQVADVQPRATEFFLVMGYRCSQNKAPKRGQTKLQTTIWSYKGVPVPLPQAESRQFGGAYNLAIEYPKRAMRSTGEIVPTTPPNGVSGGAIFQLGDLASLDQLASPAPNPPRLAGIAIECLKDSHVLVGAKISVLHGAIRTAKERP